MGSNPAQSLKFFSGLCSSSVTAAIALMDINTWLFTLIDKVVNDRLKSEVLHKTSVTFLHQTLLRDHFTFEA